jgi:hypothetical protein
MRDILIISFVVIILLVIIMVVPIWLLIKMNIAMGPYKCIDTDGNEVICRETWRSYGTLYGITSEGKSVNLKSYEQIKE